MCNQQLENSPFEADPDLVIRTFISHSLFNEIVPITEISTPTRIVFTLDKHIDHSNPDGNACNAQNVKVVYDLVETSFTTTCPICDTELLGKLTISNE